MESVDTFGEVWRLNALTGEVQYQRRVVATEIPSGNLLVQHRHVFDPGTTPGRMSVVFENYWRYQDPRVWAGFVCATDAAAAPIPNAKEGEPGACTGDCPQASRGARSVFPGCVTEHEMQSEFCQRYQLLFGDVAQDGAYDPWARGWGGAGADVQVGTSEHDQLAGGEGDDRASGGGAADVLQGGGGRDRLSGGSGDDVIEGGPGDDRLDGGRGDDVLLDEAGSDTLAAGRGDDIINVRDSDRDVVRCGPGRDIVIADEFDHTGAECERVVRPADDDEVDGQNPPGNDDDNGEDWELALAEAHRHVADARALLAARFPNGIPGPAPPFGDAEPLSVSDLEALLAAEEAAALRGDPIWTPPQSGVAGARSHRPLFSPGYRMACLGSSDGPCLPEPEVPPQYLGLNLFYGFHCGRDWHNSSDLVLDGVDACCRAHDLGCWERNRKTDVYEGPYGCSSQVNFIDCVEKAMVTHDESERAWTFILNSALRAAADVCELRPSWAWWERGWLYPLYPAVTGEAHRCAVDPWALSSATGISP